MEDSTLVTLIHCHEVDELGHALKHFGIKGMRWGVRKEDERSGNDGAKAYIASLNAHKPKKLSEEEERASLVENHQKFLAKFQPPPKVDDRGKGLSRNQKFAIGAVATAVAAGAGFLAYEHFIGGDLKVPSSPSWASKIRAMAGKPISPHDFHTAKQASIKGTWVGGNFLQPSSFARGEKTYPQGHLFRRYGMGLEPESFSHYTYATDSKADFGRYIYDMQEPTARSNGIFRGFKHIQFTAKEELRLPSTTAAVDTMREVLSREGSVATRESAIKAYNEVSGGRWVSPRATSFVEALKAKGFHGVVDEMDAGVVGESPVVLFSHERLSNKVFHDLTWAEVQDAQSSLTELSNRKLP